MVEALPGLLERLEASSGHHREERDLLEWAQRPEVMDGWRRLPARVVEKLLYHVTARARAWQEQMGSATRRPTRAFVSRLFSCAHSLKDRMDLGFIHGSTWAMTPPRMW